MAGDRRRSDCFDASASALPSFAAARNSVSGLYGMEPPLGASDCDSELCSIILSSAALPQVMSRATSSCGLHMLADGSEGKGHEERCWLAPWRSRLLRSLLLHFSPLAAISGARFDEVAAESR